MDIMGRFSNPSLIRVMQDLLGATRGFLIKALVELSRNFRVRYGPPRNRAPL